MIARYDEITSLYRLREAYPFEKLERDASNPNWHHGQLFTVM